MLACGNQPTGEHSEFNVEQLRGSRQRTALGQQQVAETRASMRLARKWGLFTFSQLILLLVLAQSVIVRSANESKCGDRPNLVQDLRNQIWDARQKVLEAQQILEKLSASLQGITCTGNSPCVAGQQQAQENIGGKIQSILEDVAPSDVVTPSSPTHTQQPVDSSPLAENGSRPQSVIPAAQETAKETAKAEPAASDSDSEDEYSEFEDDDSELESDDLDPYSLEANSAQGSESGVPKSTIESELKDPDADSGYENEESDLDTEPESDSDSELEPSAPEQVKPLERLSAQTRLVAAVDTKALADAADTGDKPKTNVAEPKLDSQSVGQQAPAQTSSGESEKIVQPIYKRRHSRRSHRLRRRRINGLQQTEAPVPSELTDNPYRPNTLTDGENSDSELDDDESNDEWTDDEEHQDDTDEIDGGEHKQEQKSEPQVSVVTTDTGQPVVPKQNKSSNLQNAESNNEIIDPNSEGAARGQSGQSPLAAPLGLSTATDGRGGPSEHLSPMHSEDQGHKTVSQRMKAASSPSTGLQVSPLEGSMATRMLGKDSPKPVKTYDGPVEVILRDKSPPPQQQQQQSKVTPRAQAAYQQFGGIAAGSWPAGSSANRPPVEQNHQANYQPQPRGGSSGVGANAQSSQHSPSGSASPYFPSPTSVANGITSLATRAADASHRFGGVFNNQNPGKEITSTEIGRARKLASESFAAPLVSRLNKTLRPSKLTGSANAVYRAASDMAQWGRADVSTSARAMRAGIGGSVDQACASGIGPGCVASPRGAHKLKRSSSSMRTYVTGDGVVRSGSRYSDFAHETSWRPKPSPLPVRNMQRGRLKAAKNKGPEWWEKIKNHARPLVEEATDQTLDAVDLIAEGVNNVRRRARDQIRRRLTERGAKFEVSRTLPDMTGHYANVPDRVHDHYAQHLESIPRPLHPIPAVPAIPSIPLLPTINAKTPFSKMDDGKVDHQVIDLFRSSQSGDKGSGNFHRFEEVKTHQVQADGQVWRSHRRSSSSSSRHSSSVRPLAPTLPAPLGAV